MFKSANCIIQVITLLLLFAVPGCFSSPSGDDDNGNTSIIADHNVARLAVLQSIPDSAINNAKSKLHIAYGHTSHGSQITDGMTGLAAWKGSKYAYNNGGSSGALDLHDYAMGGDVGSYPDWVNNTRAYLGTPDSATGRGSTNPDVNVIVWSWCGQAASRTEQSMIDTYLAPMAQLEEDYPGVTFIYMTGHLVGTGLTGNLHLRNEQIRKFCRDNGKWLFDFADIESYDPDGNYYLDKNADDECNYTGGNWATAWQNSHAKGTYWYWTDGEANPAHTQPLNANMKAYAFWWLMVRVAGWSD